MPSLPGQPVSVMSGASKYAIPKREAGDPSPLSFSQQRLWFLDQLAPGDPTYNIPYAMTIDGPLDPIALQRAMEAVVRRHEVLRTVFKNVDGIPAPVVCDEFEIELRHVDLTRVAEMERHAQARILLNKEAARPFNLSRDLMLRGLLIRVEKEKHIFLHVSHHVAWEFRSTALLYGELEEFYRHSLMGTQPNVPDLPIQYADFALWQRRLLQGEMLGKLADYWRQQLAGASNDLRLPTDFPRRPGSGNRGKRYPMVLSTSLLDAARTLSLRSGVTPFTSLLSAFAVFLHIYTGQEDLCVGSPIARRRRDEVEPLIGFFVNTLVLRTDVSGGPTFRELLQRASRVVLGAIAHADMPFDKLVEVVHPPRSAGRMPLFQVNFRVVKEPVPALRLHGLDVSPPEWIDNQTSKFDLSLELVATGGAAGFFEYSTSLFRDETIVQMATDFECLLTALISEPDIPFPELKLVRDIRARLGCHSASAR